MRSERTARFNSDVGSLPAEDQQQFRALVSDGPQSCIMHVDFGGVRPLAEGAPHSFIDGGTSNLGRDLVLRVARPPSRLCVPQP